MINVFYGLKIKATEDVIAALFAIYLSNLII